MSARARRAATGTSSSPGGPCRSPTTSTTLKPCGRSASRRPARPQRRSSGCCPTDCPGLAAGLLARAPGGWRVAGAKSGIGHSTAHRRRRRRRLDTAGHRTGSFRLNSGSNVQMMRVPPGVANWSCRRSRRAMPCVAAAAGVGARGRRALRHAAAIISSATAAARASGSRQPIRRAAAPTLRPRRAGADGRRLVVRETRIARERVVVAHPVGQGLHEGSPMQRSREPSRAARRTGASARSRRSRRAAGQWPGSRAFELVEDQDGAPPRRQLAERLPDQRPRNQRRLRDRRVAGVAASADGSAGRPPAASDPGRC